MTKSEIHLKTLDELKHTRLYALGNEEQKKRMLDPELEYYKSTRAWVLEQK